jgi:hypothetical protein
MNLFTEIKSTGFEVSETEADSNQSKIQPQATTDEQIAELQSKLTNPQTTPQERIELVKKLSELKANIQTENPSLAPIIKPQEKYPQIKKEKVVEYITIPNESAPEILSPEEIKSIENEVTFAVLKVQFDEPEFEHPMTMFQEAALKKYNETQQKVIEVVKACKSIKVVDAASNNRGREIGKSANAVIKAIDKRRLELTKPLRDGIEVINSVAKQLASPIEVEVERLKKEITQFEIESEKRRQEELKKAEEARKAKEEAEKKERERIEKIKTNIRQVENSGLQKINDCDSIDKINQLSATLLNWKPKADFYQEFFPEIQSLISDLIQKTELRRPIIEEIERQKAEAQRLEKVAQEQEAKAKLIEQEQRRANELKSKAEQDVINAEMQTKKAEQDRINAEAAKKAAQEAQAKAEEQQRKLKEQQDNAELLKITNEKRAAQFEEEQKQNLQNFLKAIGIKTFESKAEMYIKAYGSAEIAITKKNEIIQAETELRQVKNLSSKTKNLRTDYKFELEDENLIPRQYLMVDEKKIREAIVANREAIEQGNFSIPGVKIIEDVKSVLR